jgi:hypothetical protein
MRQTEPKQPTDLELAWAAGLIDGEGCIFISKGRPDITQGAINYSFALGLKVTMGHYATVQRLQTLFGVGFVGEVKYKNRPSNWNLAFTWLSTSHQAMAILNMLAPYLVTKQDEYLCAKEFMALPKWGNGRGRGPMTPEFLQPRLDAYERMKALKPRNHVRLTVA